MNEHTDDAQTVPLQTVSTETAQTTQLTTVPADMQSDIAQSTVPMKTVPLETTTTTPLPRVTSDAQDTATLPVTPDTVPIQTSVVKNDDTETAADTKVLHTVADSATTAVIASVADTTNTAVMDIPDDPTVAVPAEPKLALHDEPTLTLPADSASDDDTNVDSLHLADVADIDDVQPVFSGATVDSTPVDSADQAASTTSSVAPEGASAASPIASGENSVREESSAAQSIPLYTANPAAASGSISATGTTAGQPPMWSQSQQSQSQPQPQPTGDQSSVHQSDTAADAPRKTGPSVATIVLGTCVLLLGAVSLAPIGWLSWSWSTDPRVTAAVAFAVFGGLLVLVAVIWSLASLLHHRKHDSH